MKNNEKEVRKDSPVSAFALQDDALEKVSGGAKEDDPSNKNEENWYELPGQQLS